MLRQKLKTGISQSVAVNRSVANRSMAFATSIIEPDDALGLRASADLACLKPRPGCPVEEDVIEATASEAPRAGETARKRFPLIKADPMRST